MITDIIWRFLMLETFVMGALCCNCPYAHPQKHFCQSEFVLMAKIRGEVKMPRLKGFRMNIKHVFKGDILKLNLIQNRSVILELFSWCSSNSINTGDTYVIFGDNKYGNIYTIDCYGNMPWEKTTRFHKHALSKYYKQNCDCAPEIIDTFIQRDCKSKYSFMRKRGEHCKWKNTSDFQSCEKPKTKDTTTQRRCKSDYSFMGKSGKTCKWINTGHVQHTQP